jgi:hypothetical protein
MMVTDQEQECLGRLGFGVTRRVSATTRQLKFEQRDGTTIIIAGIEKIIKGECKAMELRDQYLNTACPRVTICLERLPGCIRVDSPQHLPLWAKIPVAC